MILMSLQPGDVITTDKECVKDMLIQVEGKNKFTAQFGQYRGSRAAKITRVIQQSLDTNEKPVETGDKPVGKQP